MTAINLDTQIVATSYDAMERVCSYTYQHSDGSQYTVKLALDELLKHRRISKSHAKQHLGKTILNHIATNPPDAKP